MVASADCGEKSKPIAGIKVSKPLMEKKRRARINKCLDQLKSLLESCYSSSIRKRKLEKADILELTVRHLRSLQKVQSCAAAARDLSDHQTGFRRCLTDVSRYLLMADSLNRSDRWTLSQLPSELCGGSFSTTDSGPGRDEPREEPRDEATSPAVKARSPAAVAPSEDAPQPPGAERSALVAARARTPRDKSSRRRRSHSAGHADGAADTRRSVWRPW